MVGMVRSQARQAVGLRDEQYYADHYKYE